MIECWMLFDEHFRLRFKHGNVDWLLVYEARRCVAAFIHTVDHGIINHDNICILYKCIDKVIAICIATDRRDYLQMFKWIQKLQKNCSLKPFDLIADNAKLHIYTIECSQSK